MLAQNRGAQKAENSKKEEVQTMLEEKTIIKTTAWSL